MAIEQVELRYAKSSFWRIIQATGVAVGGIGTPTAGWEMILHFTTEWVDVEKETFSADVDHSTGRVEVKAPPQVTQTPVYKIEEVAVKMPYAAIVNLLSAIIGQFQSFPDDLKQKIRDEVAKIPVA